MIGKKTEDKVLSWAQELKKEFDLDDVVNAFVYNSRNHLQDTVRQLAKIGKLKITHDPSKLHAKERRWIAV